MARVSRITGCRWWLVGEVCFVRKAATRAQINPVKAPPTGAVRNERRTKRREDLIK